MSPAQVADILSALPASEADEMIEFVDSENKERVQQMIDKHDENIMLYATQQVIKRQHDTVVRDVITNYRDVAGDMDVIMYVYVVNEENILQGVVDLRELIAAEPNQTLGEIMTDSLITLRMKPCRMRLICLSVTPSVLSP